MPQGVLAPNLTLIHKERGGTTKKIYILIILKMPP